MFSSMPTLLQLERLLRVICEEITTYRVWPVRVPLCLCFESELFH